MIRTEWIKVKYTVFSFNRSYFDVAFGIPRSTDSNSISSDLGIEDLFIKLEESPKPSKYMHLKIPLKIRPAAQKKINSFLAILSDECRTSRAVRN